MNDRVTNATIYEALMDIKEDIGGLKKSSDLHLEAIKNFGPRIGALETTAAKQKGKASVLGALFAAGSGIAGAFLGGWWQTRH